MQANHLNGYLIMPNQTLTIPNGGSGSGSGGTATQTSGNYTSPSFNHQNLYTEGQCTWYVFDKRSQAGKPISTYWSDAKYWHQMQRMMVIKLIILHLLVQLCKVHLDHMAM